MPKRAKSASRSHSLVSVVMPPTKMRLGTVVPYRGALRGGALDAVVNNAGADDCPLTPV